MTDAEYPVDALANIALKLVPPLVRSSLLQDQHFCEKYELQTDATLSLGNGGASFRRSTLFAAIREVLSRHAQPPVNDTSDKEWTLSVENEHEIPVLSLTSQKERIELPDFSVLSDDVAVRMGALRVAASYSDLPREAYDSWSKVLTNRPLGDGEVEDFHSDISDTPMYMQHRIRAEIASGKSSIQSLVPRSRRYFDRLVGVYDGSSSPIEYANSGALELFEGLSIDVSTNNFLRCLLLSSHAALTSVVPVKSLGHQEMINAFEFLDKQGDMLSRLGAVEVGLRILPDRPNLKPFLLTLINKIRSDQTESSESEFGLFAALFVLVDGELATTRLLAGTPPFYRRLAALAHASLIQRQLIQLKIDFGQFSDWAYGARGAEYYMQSLADMRVEPRWTPDFVSPVQMKMQFFGRLVAAGDKLRENLGGQELDETLFGSGETSLLKQCNFPYQYYPGPLEGGEDSAVVVPDELAKLIEEQLRGDDIEASSFVGLVNSAAIFKIDSNHAELAASALKLCNHSIPELKDKSLLTGILNGLAAVAAVTRMPALANELRVLVRRYRRDPQYSLTLDEAMRICLVAAAAQEDLTTWCICVGEWLTELAFGDFDKSEARLFHARLLTLLHAVPELWVSCSRAEAASAAYLRS